MIKTLYRFALGILGLSKISSANTLSKSTDQRITPLENSQFSMSPNDSNEHIYSTYNHDGLNQYLNEHTKIPETQLVLKELPKCEYKINIKNRMRQSIHEAAEGRWASEYYEVTKTMQAYSILPKTGYEYLSLRIMIDQFHDVETNLLVLHREIELRMEHGYDMNLSEKMIHHTIQPNLSYHSKHFEQWPCETRNIPMYAKYARLKAQEFMASYQTLNESLIAPQRNIWKRSDLTAEQQQKQHEYSVTLAQQFPFVFLLKRLMKMRRREAAAVLGYLVSEYRAACVFMLNLESQHYPESQPLEEICLIKSAEIWFDAFDELTDVELAKSAESFKEFIHTDNLSNALTQWLMSTSDVLSKKIRNESLNNQQWSVSDTLMDMSSILKSLKVINPGDHARVTLDALTRLNKKGIVTWMQQFTQDNEDFIKEKYLLSLCETVMNQSFYHCLYNIAPAWLTNSTSFSYLKEQAKTYREIIQGGGIYYTDISTTKPNKMIIRMQHKVKRTIERMRKNIIRIKNQLVSQLHESLEYDNTSIVNTKKQISLTLFLNDALESYYRVTLLTNYYRTNLKYLSLVLRATRDIAKTITRLAPINSEYPVDDRSHFFIATFLSTNPAWCNQITGTFDPKYNTLVLHALVNRAINMLYSLNMTNKNETLEADWEKASQNLSNVLIHSSTRPLPNIDALNFMNMHASSNNVIAQVTDTPFMNDLRSLYYRSVVERLIYINNKTRLGQIQNTYLREKVTYVTHPAQADPAVEKHAELVRKALGIQKKENTFLKPEVFDADFTVEVIKAATADDLDTMLFKYILLKKLIKRLAWDIYTDTIHNQILNDAYTLLKTSLKLLLHSILFQGTFSKHDENRVFLHTLKNFLGILCVHYGDEFNIFLLTETAFIVTSLIIAMKDNLVSEINVFMNKAQPEKNNATVKQEIKAVKKHRSTSSTKQSNKLFHKPTPVTFATMSPIISYSSESLHNKNKEEFDKNYRKMTQIWNQFNSLLKSVPNTIQIRSHTLDHAQFFIALRREIMTNIDSGVSTKVNAHRIDQYISTVHSDTLAAQPIRELSTQDKCLIVDKITQNPNISIWELFTLEDKSKPLLDKIYSHNAQYFDHLQKKFGKNSIIKTFRLTFNAELPSIDAFSHHELKDMLEPVIIQLAHSALFISNTKKIKKDKDYALKFIQYVLTTLEAIAQSISDNCNNAFDKMKKQYEDYANQSALTPLKNNSTNTNPEHSPSAEQKLDQPHDNHTTDSNTPPSPVEKKAFGYPVDLFVEENIVAFLSNILSDEPLIDIIDYILQARQQNVLTQLTNIPQFKRSLLQILELKSPKFSAPVNPDEQFDALSKINTALSILQPDPEFTHLHNFMRSAGELIAKRHNQRPKPHKKNTPVRESLLIKIRDLIKIHQSHPLNSGLKCDFIVMLIQYLNSLENHQIYPTLTYAGSNPLLTRNQSLHRSSDKQQFSLFLTPLHRHYVTHKIFLLLLSSTFDECARLFNGLLFAQEHQYSLSSDVPQQLKSLFALQSVNDSDLKQIISTWNQWQLTHEDDTEKKALLTAIGVELIKHLQKDDKLSLITTDVRDSELNQLLKQINDHSQKSPVDDNAANSDSRLSL
jgi:hypothetical protein